MKNATTKHIYLKATESWQYQTTTLSYKVTNQIQGAFFQSCMCVVVCFYFCFLYLHYKYKRL